MTKTIGTATMTLEKQLQRISTRTGRKRKYRYFVGDFETTVYDGQDSTEVWASAVVELGTEDVKILHSIDETFQYFKSLKCNMVVYYHNLKFDGNFWMYYLLHDLQYTQATEKIGDSIQFKVPKDMNNNEFTYAISDKGQWYTMRIKTQNYIIELRDSLKLLPFSVKAIGKAFKTKHQKLTMEYTGFRFAGCTITEQEQEYIANDVLVVKEALEKMFEDGYNKLTIGACCLSEFKTTLTADLYDALFPDLTEIYLDDGYGAPTVDRYIRRSYKGGWCYLVKGKENQLYGAGVTADVNSLYPSMMSSESGNRYPVGLPTWWKGNYIPLEAQQPDKYFFVRLRTRFYIKDGMLPFIQKKGSMFYTATEMLESSDLVNKATGEHSAFYTDLDGNIQSTAMELTLTCTDYILFREHYNVIDFEILDGCYFSTEIGIFDEYIEKWKQIKMHSTGAMRTEAKLFLNNLYGKMASSTDSSFKLAFMKDDGSVGFTEVEEHNKKAGYIPIGSAITSYARNFTIRAAQKNYHGVDKAGFIYADTDSIHCNLDPSEVQGITVHPTNFCCWKLEASWDKAIFARQKTYVELVVAEDLEPIDEPFWNVKCAGMPDKCKKQFTDGMATGKYQLSDFKTGLKLTGKLVPKRIKGGVILQDTEYCMRG